MAPADHPRLLAYVAEMVELCQPSAVHWCDGSEQEARMLEALLVARGTLEPLRARPGSFAARTHESDTARLEDRTFICSASREDAGPTNRWADPVATKATLRALFRGSMRGRTLYVILFCMGPLGSSHARFGLELTDSAYVALSMRIMTRMGPQVAAELGRDGVFVPGLHSVGAPLAPGEADVSWPCVRDPAGKWIAHFPDDPSIWSFGSGYGGNALLGKKCFALRIASRLARDQGWMAEHMLILGVTPPNGRTHYLAAAFPSACGKTNLAMLQSHLPGWTVRMIGDDISWMAIGADGRLYAINPEAGLFGVAPGTSWKSNPNAMATIAKDTIFTNCATSAEGDVWWEGMGTPPPPGLRDWRGAPWVAGAATPAAHPNARFTVDLVHCPALDPAFNEPEGVPIDAILFGGRRPTTMPLVVQARTWRAGVFLGATIGSQTTAASSQKTGVMRRDPFAMLPFCGYHMGDYFAHWLAMGESLGRKAPQIFVVNWFRTAADGSYLWPGFSENLRVLAWIIRRVEGLVPAVESPIGRLPRGHDLDTDGLDLTLDAREQLVGVDHEEWLHECDEIQAHFATFGERLPKALKDELLLLRRALGHGSQRFKAST
jgi:phosphoenolpyruvate carboxykinase (GTP)